MYTKKGVIWVKHIKLTKYIIFENITSFISLYKITYFCCINLVKTRGANSSPFVRYDLLEYVTVKGYFVKKCVIT